jgi:hypothetical protein
MFALSYPLNRVPVLLRISVAQDNIPQGGDHPSVSVKPGDALLCSFKNAHMDPKLFPDPETVDPRRPADNYAIQGIGTHNCPGLDACEQVGFPSKTQHLHCSFSYFSSHQLDNPCDHAGNIQASQPSSRTWLMGEDQFYHDGFPRHEAQNICRRKGRNFTVAHIAYFGGMLNNIYCAKSHLTVFLLLV